MSQLARGAIVDRYTVERPLGSGGMATVYVVRHRILGTRHALKVMRLDGPASRGRIVLEGQVQARLDSPHIVPVTDVLEVDGCPALVMPLVEGCSLAELLAHHRPTPAEAGALFDAIVSGVRAAHQAGVVHRDLKPANVLLEVKRGRVVPRVADFGLAKPLSLEQGETAIGISMGTPGYAAPEQMFDSALVDLRADLWSLGVILYELLVGRLPFRGANLVELAANMTMEPFDASPVPESWLPIVSGLLQPDLERRTASVEEVALAVEQIGVQAETLGAGGAIAESLRAGIEAGHEAAATVEVGELTPTAQTASTNQLPREHDLFVGREADLAALDEILQKGARLVSVLGVGGTGKTRLVVHHAWQHRHDYPGGAWFCDLSEARSLDGIVSAVARSLGLQLGPGDPVALLGHAIASRGPCLVILDNFEQVARHADDTLGTWLECADEASFVVTTREVLGLPGEVALALPPLGLANAVELFVARATACHRDFELADADRPHVEALVKLLDLLPLAIELAAARARLLSPAQLLERMGDRFKLLASGGGRRDRQATLRATLDWSWDLLAPWEQAALAQASVFEAGFTLEAAEAVLDLSAFAGAPWPMDAVQSLVDKSLLRPVRAGRFELLVSVQEYAAEKLRELGLAPATVVRHGRHFAEYGTEEAVRALSRRDGARLRAALASEIDNVVIACRRATSRGDAELGVPLLQATRAALDLSGPLATALELAEAMLASVELAPGDRAAVSQLAGVCARQAGTRERSTAHLEAALASSRELGDRRRESHVLYNLGNTHLAAGRLPEGCSCFESSLAFARAAGDRWHEAHALSGLSYAQQLLGQIGQARALGEEALVIYREVGNRLGEGGLLSDLGLLDGEQGRQDDQREHYEAALAIHRELGNRRYEAFTLGNLGNLDAALGHHEAARGWFEAALAIARKLGDPQFEGKMIDKLATEQARLGAAELALAGYQQALAIHRRVGNHTREALTLAGLADLHLEHGRIEEAQAAVAVALEVVPETAPASLCERLHQLGANLEERAAAE